MKHLEVLNKDKKLASVIRVTVPYKSRIEKDVYYTLMRSIASQQLSVKAADTIWNRFVSLFPNEYPEAKKVIKMNPDKMRGSGFSYQKVGYLKNIAAFSLENNFTFEHLKNLNDDEIITYLTSIKGVGKWTVEMLLMFSLGRKNVFPVDDLGIVTAMKKLYKLEEEGKALKIRCLEISQNWHPYRSMACFYLWPFKDAK